MKFCTKCGVEKELDEFHKLASSKDGHRPDCKLCVSKHRFKVRSSEKKTVESKTCYKCGLIKPSKDFSAQSQNSDGLHSWCRECIKKDSDLRILKKRIIPESGLKQCTYCMIEKPLSEFYPSKRNLNGYQSNCKLCKKDSNKTNDSRERERATRNNIKNFIKRRIQSNNKRSRETGCIGKITVEDLDKIFKDQNCKCNYCKIDLDIYDYYYPTKYHIDHINPTSVSKDNTINNIQILCDFCNLGKGRHTHEEFLAYINRLINNNKSN